jgi:hypothetical protein
VSVVPISALEYSSSERRLAALLTGRGDLGAAVQAAQLVLQGHPDGSGPMAAWSDVVRALIEVNLGDAVVLGFLRASTQWPPARPVSDLVVIGQAVWKVGRATGSRVAYALLSELPKVLAKLASTDELTTLLIALEGLAETAPESVGLVVGRLEQLLAHVGAADFSLWVSGGLRAAGGRAARRRAYFALDDGLSTRLLHGHGGAVDDFARLERRLAATMRALWNVTPRFRKLPIASMPPVPRRASLAGGLLGLPETYPGFDGDRADRIYLAACAHAGAHLAHSGVRFPIGRLKPLQIALVSLIEDARVEALALRDMPGLGRLWLLFHAATPSSRATAAGLMMRLSRALIDPGYEDPDAWIAKGRALFREAAGRLGDPAISREIGGLLGNDIGQMRLQFDARGYVVEPAYRDDNLALWDFGEQADGPVDEIELAVDTVRKERRDTAGSSEADQSAPPDQTLRARASAVTMLDGLPVARYPEWDHAARIERPDWTTVLEADAATSARPGDSVVNDDTTRRIATITREASIGRRRRHKGQRDGDALDLDAAIALMIERRAGRFAEPRVYLRDTPGPRDLAILVLLDLSQSTADRDRQGRSVIDIERRAAGIIAAAVETAGDAIAIHGFNSDGRERVRYLRIKDFGEETGAIMQARLTGLTSGYSTRLGPALRHAGSYLTQRRAFRKVLLVLTDGEPSDIDVPDPVYLAEDARRAVQQLRRRGIDTFALGLGNGPFSRLDRIFGERRALRVARIEALPQRVVQLYGELKK